MHFLYLHPDFDSRQITAILAGEIWIGFPFVNSPMATATAIANPNLAFVKYWENSVIPNTFKANFNAFYNGLSKSLFSKAADLYPSTKRYFFDRNDYFIIKKKWFNHGE